MPILITKQLSKLSKLRNQTKKLPLNIQKPKISLKSQNFRKLTGTRTYGCGTLGGGTLRYLDIRVLGYMGTGT